METILIIVVNTNHSKQLYLSPPFTQTPEPLRKLAINVDWKLNGESHILNFGSQQFSYKILKLRSSNFDVLINTDYDGDNKVDKLEIYATKETCSTGDPYY